MKQAKTNLTHTINLEIGDWSGDGHSQKEFVTIHSNLSKDELTEAYKAGTKITGVEFEDEVASEYEDNRMSKDILQKLAKHGFKIEDYFNDDEEPDESDEDQGYELWVDNYALVWLFVAKVGNPTLEFDVDNAQHDRIYIGGYGLFST